MEEFPVLKYTVQLYYSPEETNNISESPPIQIASGVLISGVQNYYLLTCKHVFDGINVDDVVILISAGFAVRLIDEIEFINDEKDSIDLALVQLKEERLEALKEHYSFLPKQNLGLNHVFDEELFYMLFGFINRRTTLKDHAFYVESFGYLTNIRRYKKIEKLGFDYTNNITLEYNRRKQSDLGDDMPKLGFRELKGLSGGGIWLSEAGEVPDTYNYVLVGIMIEERIDRGFVIGTKVALIEKLIS